MTTFFDAAISLSVPRAEERNFREARKIERRGVQHGTMAYSAARRGQSQDTEKRGGGMRYHSETQEASTAGNGNPIELRWKANGHIAECFLMFETKASETKA